MKKEDTINPFNINNKKEKNEELEEKEDDEYYYDNLLIYNKNFNIERNIKIFILKILILKEILFGKKYVFRININLVEFFLLITYDTI